MNSLTDTLGTLLPDARNLAEGVMAGARQGLNESGQIAPCAFAVTTGGVPEIYAIGRDFDDKTKPEVWAMVRWLRKTRPVVAFVSEVWKALEQGCRRSTTPAPSVRSPAAVGQGR